MKCDVLDYAHFLGKKWSVVLFEEIALGKFTGFNKTLSKAGLTPKILSGQLKEMEKLGLINKTKVKPAHYDLTKKGQEFRKIIKEIKNFNIKWADSDESCIDTSCIECQQLTKPSR